MKLELITANRVRNAVVLGLVLGMVLVVTLCAIVDLFQINFSF